MAKIYEDEHEVRVPTLLIGIGGIGGRIVSDVYDQISEYDKKFISILVMDTDTNALESFDGKSIPIIQTSEKRNVADYLESNEEFLEWFPTNTFINSKNLTDGAGQIRAVSRLGALASEGAGKFDKIKRAIYDLSRNRGTETVKALKVMIVGSITGGTGSGIAVQLPFYIRKLVAEETSSPDILIRGLFLGPDVTSRVQETDGNEDAMYVNAYAFMRELNAFFAAQLMDEKDIKIDIEYYDKGKRNEGKKDELRSANQIPYNFIFLLESSNKNGENLGELEAYEKQAAKIIKNQLFSPISSTQYSSEDNLIINSIEEKGMDRYCGAGYAAAKYPKDEVLRYCTLKYCDKIIEDYWMYFDQKYEEDNRIQLANMERNHSLRPLIRKEHYINTFIGIRKDPDAPAGLGLLTTETIEEKMEIDERTEGSKKVSREVVDILTKGISDFIKASSEDNRFTEEYVPSDFEPNAVLLKSKDSAQGEIGRVINNLANYEKTMEKVVAELAISCASTILPASREGAKALNGKADYDLYNRLRKMHPLSARFVLYSLQNWLDEAKLIADSQVEKASISKIRDNYGKGKSATGAISDMATKGWFDSLMDDAFSRFNNLIRGIKDDVSAEAKRIGDYGKQKFAAIVYDYLLVEVKKLIDIYEGFFDGLKDVIESYEEQIRLYESKEEEEIISSERLVCFDGKCLKELFNEVVVKSGGKMMELSQDVKDGLFDQFYRVYEVLPSNGKYTEGDKLLIGDTNAYFEKALLPKLKENVLEFGSGVIDVTVFEAIRKEYDIRCKELTDAGKPVTVEYKEYLSSMMSQVTNLAKPYLNYKKDKGTMAYWGINRSVALRLQGSTDGKSDDTKIKTELGLNTSAEKHTIVLDSAFNPYEAVCYKVVHGLRIENLGKYENGKHCHTKYMERLNNVINGTAEISKNGRGELATTHPHLDKRWHQRAYLPWFSEQDNADAKSKDIYAFFMGLGLSKLKYAEYDYTECWCYEDVKDAYPIKEDEKALTEKSYIALLSALAYNKVIRDDIIKMSDELRASAKSGMRLEDEGETPEDRIDLYYDEIAKHKIVRIFMGKDHGTDSYNFVDMICDMRFAEGDSEDIDEMIEFIHDYLMSYCNEMTRGQEGLAKKVYHRLAVELCKKSDKIKTSSLSTKRKVYGTLEVSESEVEDDSKKPVKRKK